MATEHPSVVGPGDPEPPVGTVLALRRMVFDHADEGWYRSNAPDELITWVTVGGWISEAFERGRVRREVASVVKWGTA